MQYFSTRGEQAPRRFCEILLEGLSPDGGLYLPKTYPVLNLDALEKWRQVLVRDGYAALAFEVLRLYVDDIPEQDLRRLAEATYTADCFGDPVITPMRQLGCGLYLQGLSTGPTLAFKDIAMQLLGQLFEYELGRRKQQLNILGATSGDTGSAAEYAMRGRRGIRVFMLSPAGRMSAFQQAQMYSLQDANIHNIAIDGVFDDCQDIVKAVSADLEFKRRWQIGTVNSINWARLLAQVVYYFAGYFAVTSHSDERVSFAVPSGNFGNVCAGHIARQMGLPIARLVVATNENDVLDEFFRTGIYRPRGSADTQETNSPSMDISKASNFERFVADLLGRDAGRVGQLFGVDLPETGQFDLHSDPRFQAVSQEYGFYSGRCDAAGRRETIARLYREQGVLLDPHTANGVYVAQDHREEGIPMIVLETAQPAKFAEAIQAATGIVPPRPAVYEDLEQRPQKAVHMAVDAEAVKTRIASVCGDDNT